MVKALVTFFKIGFGILVALITVEGALHVVEKTPVGKIFPVVEPQLGQPDHDIGFALTPGKKVLWTKENSAFIEINSKGLRDKEYRLEKPEHTYRIALTGDSVVEALQVENHTVFENLAENRLQEEGSNIEIINFAMSGNGPLRQLVRLEKFAKPFSPDMTIMLMSLNDFLTEELRDDSANPAYKITDKGEIVRGYAFRGRSSQKYSDRPVGKVFLFLLHNSNIFRLLWQKKEEPIQKIMGLNLFRKQSVPTTKNECHSKDIEDLYAYWVKKADPENWSIVDHYLSEVAFYAGPNPLVIGTYIPLVTTRCVQEKEQREAIVISVQEIMSRKNIFFIDWNQEVQKRLGAGQGIEMLRGFGVSYGTGHLNYDGHEKFSEVLYDIIKSQYDSFAIVKVLED